ELKKADAALVLSNRRDLEAVALSASLPFVQIPWENRLKAEQEALKVLEGYEIDFVVLARFMKILSPNFVWRYKNNIINIHPSLLPSFPGPQAYRQATSGASRSSVSLLTLSPCIWTKGRSSLRPVFRCARKWRSRTLSPRAKSLKP